MSEFEEMYGEIRICPKCKLAESRTNAVPGEGPHRAQILFIGEAPGFHEDRQGRPFVGAAGQFLNELLEQVGLKREDVYITNVVKCRPPSNRDPQPDEIAACRPYLDRLIELLHPRLIVTLGRYSMDRYFPGASITKIHGQPKRVGTMIVYPMFHPAAALHQPRYKSMIEEDMQRIPELLAQLDKVEGRDEEPPPPRGEQLSLF